jgi:hypothetical protein
MGFLKPSPTVKSLADSIRQSDDPTQVEPCAQRLEGLILKFQKADREYAIEQLTAAMSALAPDWKRKLAEDLLVKIRTSAGKTR